MIAGPESQGFNSVLFGGDQPVNGIHLMRKIV